MAAVPGLMLLPLAGLAAVLLDRLFGEPPRFHPLVGFGKLADFIERRLNLSFAAATTGGGTLAAGVRAATDPAGRAGGVLAWAFAVLPWVALAAWVCDESRLGWIGDVLLLTLALGGRSLAEHATRVGADLVAGDLDAARRHVSFLVSRNTAELDEEGVARACVESTLENGADAIFAALFWFALFGGAGAVLYRLANTLDAMWGYRTPRLAAFGWAAARIDDLLNYVPARLTATAYALCGATRTAFACWRRQAPQWDSPNAGPVMAAGAGALGVRLGGAAIYHGRVEERPDLGAGLPPRGTDIGRAVALVRRALLLWLAVWMALALLAAGWQTVATDALPESGGRDDVSSAVAPAAGLHVRGDHA